MVVKNPLKHDLEIQYEGIVYRVAANGETKNVPEEVATYWKNKIHQFIEISNEASEKARPVTVGAPAPAEPEPVLPENIEVVKVEKKTATKKK